MSGTVVQHTYQNTVSYSSLATHLEERAEFTDYDRPVFTLPTSSRQHTQPL